MTIKTFRGLMGTTASNNAQIENISLHTRDGSIGYRIVKFELMPYDFGAAASELEATVKIYKVPQTTADSKIDFSDNTLAAAAVFACHADPYIYGIAFSSVFDNEIFNQDISLTYYNNKTNEAAGFINYYIELEQMKLDLNENTVATLKDIRNVTAPT